MPTMSRLMRGGAATSGGTNPFTGRPIGSKPKKKKGEEGNKYQKQLDDMIKQMQSKYDEANAANESRYGDILGQYEDRYNRNTAELDKIGQTRRADINRDFDNLGTRQSQDLISRGLSTSTVAPTVQSANMRNRQAAMTAADESAARAKIDIDSQLSGDKLNFMERRNDVGPDLGMIADLAMKAGEWGRGMGDGAAAQPVKPAGSAVPGAGGTNGGYGANYNVWDHGYGGVSYSSGGSGKKMGQNKSERQWGSGVYANR